MRIRICCPHCLTRSVARTSLTMSPTLREITYRCENDECRYVYVAQLEIVRTLSPSAMPNPSVKVPMSPHVRRRLAEQLELPV